MRNNFLAKKKKFFSSLLTLTLIFYAVELKEKEGRILKMKGKDKSEEKEKQGMQIGGDFIFSSSYLNCSQVTPLCCHIIELTSYKRSEVVGEPIHSALPGTRRPREIWKKS